MDAASPTVLDQPGSATAKWSAADVAMRRFLRITDAPGPPRVADAHRAFTTSMLVSATRCLLTYVLFPFVAPALGQAAGVGPVVGLAIGAVAISANVLTIRRFWLANHRWRWAYTAVAVCVIGLLLVLVVIDVRDLLG